MGDGREDVGWIACGFAFYPAVGKHVDEKGSWVDLHSRIPISLYVHGPCDEAFTHSFALGKSSNSPPPPHSSIQ